MDTTVHHNIEFAKIEDAYKSFILCENHPFIASNALFKIKKYYIKIYDDIQRKKNLKKLLSDLENILPELEFKDDDFETFIASFPNDYYEDEVTFEKDLSQTLQMLHRMNKTWDERVHDEEKNISFTIQLSGRTFYVVGLHANSSKLATQAPYTTLVFNCSTN